MGVPPAFWPNLARGVPHGPVQLWSGSRHVLLPLFGDSHVGCAYLVGVLCTFLKFLGSVVMLCCALWTELWIVLLS